MANSSLKGHALEYFVRTLLYHCGFKAVPSDGLLVFDGSAGQMIQGLGECHNADVLVSPPIQTPFYFQTRLVVECKCYSDKLGIGVVRNVLGLREDINNFDIVTEDILNNRKSGRSTKQRKFPMERYLYQVALASLSGFKKTTISFAATHRIPLISFADSQIFEDIRNRIENLDRMKNKEDIKILERFFRTSKNEYYDDRIWELADAFIQEVDNLAQKVKIGLLENGLILFLVENEKNNPHLITDDWMDYGDGYTLHWADDKKSWLLCNRDKSYYFELPDDLMRKWEESVEDSRRGAISLKEMFLSRIILFGGNSDFPEIMELSNAFMDNAKRKLEIDNR